PRLLPFDAADAPLPLARVGVRRPPRNAAANRDRASPIERCGERAGPGSCDNAAMVVGSQIGSYRIGRTLGGGGMGGVDIGVDVGLGRRAAIKQLLPELSTQRDIVERFFNEAKAAANISHPGIVEIYEVGWHTDGSAYFAMKLLEGDSLARRLRAGPMPVAT